MAGRTSRSTGNGRFYAEYDKGNYRAETLDALREQLTKANRKALDKKAIPVTVIGIVPSETPSRYGRTEPYQDGIGVLNARFRGKHQRTRDWLLIAEGETAEERKKFSLGGYGKRDQVMCRRLTLAETLEYIRLANAAKFAAEQLDIWIGERKVDPKTLIEGDDDI